MKMRTFARLRMIVFGVLFVGVLLSGAQAGVQVPFSGGRGSADPYLAVAPPSQEKGLFFDTLGTHGSDRGAVKSFNVSLAKRRQLSRAVGSTVRLPADFQATGPLGKFMMPVSGKISSYFGYRKHPYRRISRTFHTGIDIPARTGTGIRVVAPGRVIYAGWRSGYGLMVEVDHGNGMSTVYAHCSRLSVKLGQTVGTGQTIGQVGRTGITTGSHLHFEVRRKGSVIDPMRYLSSAR